MKNFNGRYKNVNGLQEDNVNTVSNCCQFLSTFHSCIDHDISSDSDQSSGITLQDSFEGKTLNDANLYETMFHSNNDGSSSVLRIEDIFDENRLAIRRRGDLINVVIDDDDDNDDGREIISDTKRKRIRVSKLWLKLLLR